MKRSPRRARATHGVGLECSCVGEAGAIVTDLSQQSCADQWADAGKAGEHGGVGVLGEGFLDRGGQLLLSGAGGVELAQQSPQLSSEGRLHDGRQSQLLFAEQLMKPLDVGVHEADPAGLGQGGEQLPAGQRRRSGGAGRQAEDRPCVRSGQPAMRQARERGDRGR